ncbi:hypothetical protein [Lewinella sp. JB7]|uniref:hypothetical protein n=1 Tax=Lewinella sp. JB7 TaxID=2962887 RepID=UPI0020C979E4|nr:hypothetical protein [Lewinella sp. JB7]MCP9237191.1 hypothetical protein [Lewinella sp. JB7]
MRIICLLTLFLFCFRVGASDLGHRLRLLFPGEEPTAVSERTYLTKQLENVFRQLRYRDRVDRRSIKRQAKQILERYEKQVFRTYDPAAELSDAFRSGRYNDATAAVLLALTLEEFNIAYESYVDHWESYLVLDPAGKRLLLRNPAAQPHEPEAERAFRREYLTLVRSMLDQDLTALSPAQADSVFYQYYYRPNQRLNFVQLSAYEQFRLAQSAYAAADYAATSRHVATALEREARLAFVVLDEAAKVQLSSLQRPDEAAYLRRMFSVWRAEPSNRYVAATLLRHFDGGQEALLAEDRPTEAASLLTRYLTESPASATAWRTELQLLQRLRLLGYYQGKGALKEARQLAEILHAEDPTDQRYQDYVAELVLVDLRNSYPDAEELVAQTEQAAEQYPFLRSHDRYADVILRRHAIRVRDYFARLDAPGGLSALAEFRKVLAEVPGGLDRRLWTLTAFVAASNYYFAEEDYAPARAYIEEALSHDPANDFLLHQQDLLSRY